MLDTVEVTLPCLHIRYVPNRYRALQLRTQRTRGGRVGELGKVGQEKGEKSRTTGKSSQSRTSRRRWARRTSGMSRKKEDE